MIGISRLRQTVRILSARMGMDTSQFGEREIIKEYLLKLNLQSDFVIDIGAMDGINASNTYNLFVEGNPGFAIEADNYSFAILSGEYKTFNTNLLKIFVTPDNVLQIFKLFNAPKHPMFMNLDIDSYDFYVLDKILSEYRPSLVCTEINENIPPQFKFTVTPNSTIKCNYKYHFYGMSISMLEDLCKKYSYDIVKLNYVNVFIIPHEKNIFKSYTSEDAYHDGYWNKPDRKQRFSYNADMETLFTMNTNDGKKFINDKFSQFNGMYLLE